MDIFEVVEANPKATIVVFGCGQIGHFFGTLAEKLGISIHAFCDNKQTLWGSTFCGYPVISPEVLQQLHQEQGDHLWVQIALSHEKSKKQTEEIQTQLHALGLTQIITPLDILHFYIPLHNQFIQKYPEHQGRMETLRCLTNENREKRKTMIHSHSPSIYQHIFICQPAKTGDSTLSATYTKAKQVEIQHAMHQPAHFDRKEAQKLDRVKVTTAIRDPISRDISNLFHKIGHAGILNYPYIQFQDYADFLSTKDPQPLFDKMVAQYFLIDAPQHTGEKIPYYQQFFTRFQKHILDVTQVPFDQEKGYAIVKEGNVDVFFYQLEKLNSLVPELSDFMGVPFDTLENDNIADEKWVAPYYAQAKNELKFSKAYFEACYKDPYVRHCYSEADIEKFKARWQGQVEPN